MTQKMRVVAYLDPHLLEISTHGEAPSFEKGRHRLSAYPSIFRTFQISSQGHLRAHSGVTNV